MSELKPSQQRFCHYYLESMNAGKAARQAGYSEKTADQAGSRLLRSVKVQAFLKKQLSAVIGSEHYSIQREVLANLKRMAFDAESRDADRLKAMELLIKYLGLFNDTQSSTDTTIQIVWPDAQSLEVIERHGLPLRTV